MQPLVKIGTEFNISGHRVVVKSILKDHILGELHDAQGVREITLDLDKVADAVTQEK